MQYQSVTYGRTDSEWLTDVQTTLKRIVRAGRQHQVKLNYTVSQKWPKFETLKIIWIYFDDIW